MNGYVQTNYLSIFLKPNVVVYLAIEIDHRLCFTENHMIFSKTKTLVDLNISLNNHLIVRNDSVKFSESLTVS